MATQSASNPAARNTQSAVKGNVSVPSGKPSIGRNIEQPKIGKLGDGMSAMSGSKGKGQSVATVKSNPIAGAKSAQPGNTAMGSGSVINGFA